MNFKEILMVKFYVVDGVSYPAAETAVGIFDGHGYKSMNTCRNIGIKNTNYKGSMSHEKFINFLKASNIQIPTGESAYNVGPLTFYLENNGFGVTTDETELFLAEQYLVYKIPYVKAEEKAKLFGEKGFQAMYAVCKLGGFSGAKNKGSMNLEQFKERKKALNLHPKANITN